MSRNVSFTRGIWVFLGISAHLFCLPWERDYFTFALWPRRTDRTGPPNESCTFGKHDNYIRLWTLLRCNIDELDDCLRGKIEICRELRILRWDASLLRPVINRRLPTFEAIILIFWIFFPVGAACIDPGKNSQGAAAGNLRTCTVGGDTTYEHAAGHNAELQHPRRVWIGEREQKIREPQSQTHFTRSEWKKDCGRGERVPAINKRAHTPSCK